jgi:hypothetical protein
MARPEVTGRSIGTTPVKSKRPAGPATADDDAIEPSDEADEATSPVSAAHRARAPPPPEAVESSDVVEVASESEVKKKQPQRVKFVQSPLAFSVEQFCRAHNISIGFFDALLKRGEAPDIMKLGIRTLISHEAAARWRAERTAASSGAAGDAA